MTSTISLRIASYLSENFEITDDLPILTHTSLLTEKVSEFSSISYIDDPNFVDKIDESIVVIFITSALAKELQIKKSVRLIISENPRLDFYLLHNYLYKNELYLPSVIPNCVEIGDFSYIAPTGVSIGCNTTIGRNVTICSGVDIGNNGVIQDGVVLGREGFEFKRSSNGELLHVQHEAKLIIGDRVVVGANSTIGRGVMNKPTTVGHDCKIDYQVSIAHSSEIEDSVLIGAGAILCGRTKIGSNVWLGPGCLISNGVSIGQRAHVALGSVVTKDVQESQRVWGSPARPFNF